MDIRFNMQAVAGPVSVSFQSDYLINLILLDSNTGEVLHDFSGENAVHVSQLLTELPPEALEELVREKAVDLVKLVKGVG